MLSIKNKKIESYKCPFCTIVNCKISLNKKDGTLSSPDCSKLDQNLKSFFLNSTPMIKGKTVDLDIALVEAKKLIRQNKQIHIDGFGCDQIAMEKIINFAEKKKCSIDHMHGHRISNFFSALQRYGGSFVSFNEIKNRSDFILFIGQFENQLDLRFLEKLEWNDRKIKKSIFTLPKTLKIKEEKKYLRYNLIDQINYLKRTIKGVKVQRNREYKLLIDSFLAAKYPVFIPKIELYDYGLSAAIFDFIKTINVIKKTRIFNFGENDNSSGFINSCVTKTGFPNAVSFSDWGAIYDPNEFSSSKLMNYKDLQIYVSNFNYDPEIDFFKKNIFIGHPNAKNKKKFDVFIPTKIPGIDQDGLIVRPDLIGILKLRRIFDSDYPVTSKIFDFLDD